MKLKTPDKILKNHGLRITETRKDILQVFLKMDKAITQQEIEESIGELDRITLYRTLKAFESKGVIHKAIDGTDQAKYAICQEECDSDHHHHEHVHFHCEVCENTFCVEVNELPDFQGPEGFKVTSSSIILRGMCENCA